uniref:Replication factor A C-terminal domain-containing protein n=1 Tax=Amphimedon queenslandica TaxID=400682 RepID=A0A1X7U897_AMPQE
MNVLTRQYEGAKHISFCDSSSIEQMDQIDGISSEEEDYEEVNHLQSIKAVTDGQIILVLSTTDYLSCVACSGSIIHISDTLAKCTKCRATMKISNCTSCKSARLLILDNLKKKWNLTAYNEQLEDIIQEASGDSLEEKLLNSNKFTLHYYTATNELRYTIPSRKQPVAPSTSN